MVFTEGGKKKKKKQERKGFTGKLKCLFLFSRGVRAVCAECRRDEHMVVEAGTMRPVSAAGPAAGAAL